MRPSTHHYVLPVAFLALHGVLLLPTLLPSRHPDNRQTRPPKCLHPGYAVPLGIAGFVVIHAIRWLAGGIPLPQHRRQRRLASRIEWGLLFLLGVCEELWRWGLVRVLVELEGGRGGYGGTAAGLSQPSNGAPAVSSASTLGRLSIWEGVYLMCWTWSLAESTGAWFSLWPPTRSGHLSRTPLSARFPSQTSAQHRYLGYGVFRVPTCRASNVSGGDEGSISSRTLHRPSDSSRSSVGNRQSFFTDLFIRKRPPGSIRSVSSSGSPQEETEQDEARAAMSDPSSDGDDEDSSSSAASDASLSRQASRANSPTRPLLGSAPSSSSHTPLRSTSTPSLQQDPTSPATDNPPQIPSTIYTSRRPSTLRLSARRGSTSHHQPSSPTIYTLPLRTLSAIYPILWRLTSLLTHLAYGLLYAWFPSLILSLPSRPGVHAAHKTYLEWWTLVVLLGVCACKGYSTVFWFRGTAARVGVAWATGASLNAAAMAFLVGLALWGVVEEPWD